MHTTTTAQASALARMLAAAPARGDARRSAWEDEVARHAIPFARAIAMHYRDRGIDGDILVAVANYALARAILQFDPERGGFLSYAASTIHGEIKKFFRDKSWCVRPTRHLQELQIRIRREHEADPEHPPTVDELAARFGTTPHDVRGAMTAAGSFLPTALENLANSNLLATDQTEFDRIDDLLMVADAVRHMPQADRDLIRLRFFDEMTQAEIAAMLGVSQMQVSRRLRRLLDDLRSHLNGPLAA